MTRTRQIEGLQLYGKEGLYYTLKNLIVYYVTKIRWNFFVVWNIPSYQKEKWMSPDAGD